VENLHVKQVILLLQFDYKTNIPFDNNSYFLITW